MQQLLPRSSRSTEHNPPWPHLRSRRLPRKKHDRRLRTPPWPTANGGSGARCLREHHHAILEAGTGTGKTLAYLLPAICSGRRVVISTATKSLQEQLYQKDVPFLQSTLLPTQSCVMKGRSNFLCLAKCMPWPTSRFCAAWRKWTHSDRSRLGPPDGNGRPRGTHLFAGRLRIVDAN